MLHFKTGPTGPFTLKTSWNEVTVADFMAIRALKNTRDVIGMLAIMTGLKYSDWFNCTMREKDMDVILTGLKWIEDVPDWKTMPVPATYTIADKVIPVPKELTLDALGCRYTFENEIFPSIEKTGDVVECLDRCLAIYFFTRYTGKDFDTDKLQEITPLILQSKIVEAYPIGRFFLTKYIKSSIRKTRHSYISQIQKRFKLVLTSSAASA